MKYLWWRQPRVHIWYLQSWHLDSYSACSAVSSLCFKVMSNIRRRLTEDYSQKTRDSWQHEMTDTKLQTILVLLWLKLSYSYMYTAVLQFLTLTLQYNLILSLFFCLNKSGDLETSLNCNSHKKSHQINPVSRSSNTLKLLGLRPTQKTSVENRS